MPMKRKKKLIISVVIVAAIIPMYLAALWIYTSVGYVTVARSDYAREICDAYIRNRAEANNEYRHRWVYVTGKVVNKEMEPFGLLKVDLWGDSGPGSDLRFYFAPNQSKYVADLTVGKTASITGYCIGDWGRVVFINCLTGDGYIVRKQPPKLVLTDETKVYFNGLGNYHITKNCKGYDISSLRGADTIINVTTKLGLTPCPICIKQK